MIRIVQRELNTEGLEAIKQSRGDFIVVLRLGRRQTTNDVRCK